MKTLYLHVGPHKTGTTFIQKSMLDNAAEIFRSNLVYPKRFLRIFGHHDFRDALASKAIHRRDLDFFKGAEQNFLLSSEDFISLTAEHFGYLRDAFPDMRFIVLYAWRRAGFRLYSIWQETVKHGGTSTFFDYYHEHLARPGHSMMLSPDLKLGMFSQVFGKENVRVIDYDASTRNGSLLRDFLTAVDVPWTESFVTPENNPEAVNQSMDFADIEVIRALNHILAQRFGINGASVRLEYARQLERLEQAGLAGLKALVRQYHLVLTVGNYQIDNRCERIMAEQFRQNMLNYEPNTSVKNITVARPDWVLDLEAQKILNGLADILHETMA